MIIPENALDDEPLEMCIREKHVIDSQMMKSLMRSEARSVAMSRRMRLNRLAPISGLQNIEKHVSRSNDVSKPQGSRNSENVDDITTKPTKMLKAYLPKIRSIMPIICRERKCMTCWWCSDRISMNISKWKLLYNDRRLYSKSSEEYIENHRNHVYRKAVIAAAVIVV